MLRMPLFIGIRASLERVKRCGYDTQSLADTQEEEYVPTSSGVVAAKSKAKAKPQPRESTGTTTIPLNERVWIDIEPSKQDLESHNLSKKVINLLRHNQKLHR